jgi:hypothetical protein
MTSLTEKARAGRIKALEGRDKRRNASINIFGGAAKSAAARRNEMPVFISARSRTETPVFLH